MQGVQVFHLDAGDGELISWSFILILMLIFSLNSYRRMKKCSEEEVLKSNFFTYLPYSIILITLYLFYQAIDYLIFLARDDVALCFITEWMYHFLLTRPSVLVFLMVGLNLLVALMIILLRSNYKKFVGLEKKYLG